MARGQPNMGLALLTSLLHVLLSPPSTPLCSCRTSSAPSSKSSPQATAHALSAPRAQDTSTARSLLWCGSAAVSAPAPSPSSCHSRLRARALRWQFARTNVAAHGSALCIAACSTHTQYGHRVAAHLVRHARTHHRTPQPVVVPLTPRARALHSQLASTDTEGFAPAHAGHQHCAPVSQVRLCGRTSTRSRIPQPIVVLLTSQARSLHLAGRPPTPPITTWSAPPLCTPPPSTSLRLPSMPLSTMPP